MLANSQLLKVVSLILQTCLLHSLQVAVRVQTEFELLKKYLLSIKSIVFFKKIFNFTITVW